ncbi:hypothetical protein BZA02_105318 [Ruegeria sp. P4]|nr:hypothetical protein BZA02_105318 [Ruegeria sp. P4]
MADGGYDAAQAAAASQSGNAVGGGCAECHTGNWIHVRYEYTEGDPVTDAVYVVQTPNDGATGGSVIAEGVISIGPDAEHNYVHVDLGDHSGPVEVFVFDDPTEPAPYEEPQPVEDEAGWLSRAANAVMSGAEWTWDVAQGDFNEDMSTGQIITNAVVTAVPGIDQVADARDLIANGKALIWDRRYTELVVWVGVFACLIGLVPSLGSLAKGVIKLVWRNAGEVGKILIYINKALHKTGMKINGYRFLKELADELPGHVGTVTQKFNSFLDSCLRKLPSWGGAQLRESIEHVRSMANSMFPRVADEIQQRLLRGLANFASRAWRVVPGQGIIVRRSMQATRQAYDSWQDTMRRVGFDKTALEAGAEPIDASTARFLVDIEELSAKWAEEFLADPNLPRYLREQAEASPEFFRKQLATFGSKPRYETFAPGQSLYRVIDNADGHTGGFWSKSMPPDEESVWRARDAVLNDWNEAGAFIRAELPPPPAGFIGEIAPQKLADGQMLRGGGEQVWLPGPRSGSVSRDQVKDYWHTTWNDRAPTSPSRASLRAGNPNECDL